MASLVGLIKQRVGAKLSSDFGVPGAFIADKLQKKPADRRSFGTILKQRTGASLSKNFGLIGAYADHRMNSKSSSTGTSSSTGADDKHRSTSRRTISGSDVTAAIAESGQQVLAEITAVDHTARIGFEKVRRSEAAASGRVLEKLDDISDEVDALGYRQKRSGGNRLSSPAGVQPTQSAVGKNSSDGGPDLVDKIKTVAGMLGEGGALAVLARLMPATALLGLTYYMAEKRKSEFIQAGKDRAEEIKKNPEKFHDSTFSDVLHGRQTLGGWWTGAKTENDPDAAKTSKLVGDLTYTAKKIIIEAKSSITFKSAVTGKPGGGGSAGRAGKATTRTNYAGSAGGGSRPRTILPSSQAQSGQVPAGSRGPIDNGATGGGSRPRTIQPMTKGQGGDQDRQGGQGQAQPGSEARLRRPGPVDDKADQGARASSGLEHRHHEAGSLDRGGIGAGYNQTRRPSTRVCIR